MPVYLEHGYYLASHSILPVLASKAVQICVVELQSASSVCPATYTFEGTLATSEATRTRTRAGFCKQKTGAEVEGLRQEVRNRSSSLHGGMEDATRFLRGTLFKMAIVLSSLLPDSILQTDLNRRRHFISAPKEHTAAQNRCGLCKQRLGRKVPVIGGKDVMSRAKRWPVLNNTFGFMSCSALVGPQVETARNTTHQKIKIKTTEKGPELPEQQQNAGDNQPKVERMVHE